MSYYTKVFVIRRGEDGSPLVRARSEVPYEGKFKPPGERVFFITDFHGDATEAQLHAKEVAKSLALL